MSKPSKHLDHLLVDWPFSTGQVLVRRTTGADGRDILQMRVDLGVLQMETSGRPDGTRFEDCETYFDYLQDVAKQEGDGFRLDEQQCNEIDREFYQFYHRRICWLSLRAYAEAAADADHTLALMKFSTNHAPEPEWALLHEQYRPFVMFHRIQAVALQQLEESEADGALKTIDEGLEALADVFEQHDASEHYSEDAFVIKLREMRESIVERYEMEPSLADQLAEAIAAEQYELAAELRDRLSNTDEGFGSGPA